MPCPLAAWRQCTLSWALRDPSRLPAPERPSSPHGVSACRASPMTRQTRIMTQTINLFHQADHVGPRVASSAAPETKRPMPSIGGARHYASSAAPAASRAAAGRGLCRLAAPVRTRSRGGRCHLGPRLWQVGAAGPRPALWAGSRRPLATQAHCFAAAGPRTTKRGFFAGGGVTCSRAQTTRRQPRIAVDPSPSNPSRQENKRSQPPPSPPDNRIASAEMIPSRCHIWRTYQCTHSPHCPPRNYRDPRECWLPHPCLMH